MPHVIWFARGATWSGSQPPAKSARKVDRRASGSHFSVLLLAVCGAVADGGGDAFCQAQRADQWEAARERMVREDLMAGGITDPRVLAAMRNTPRHAFVPLPQRPRAYYDMALPIGDRQTISGTFVVAYMTEQLEPAPTDRVLEIGTGSGYQAAVLSPLVETVYTIEIEPELGRRAARTLERLGYTNVVTRIGDGFAGWPEHAPFDKIIVTCSPENVPQPLVDQLAEGGRMIIPVGERFEQSLVLMKKRGGVLSRTDLVPSLFVPMTGRAEDARTVQPDGASPRLRNGGFEQVMEDGETPSTWYYGRQMEVVVDPTSPEGSRHLRLNNSDAGRPARVFQGFPVDGSVAARLRIDLMVRGETIRRGVVPLEQPAVTVTFFDHSRARSATASFGGWLGTFEWREERGDLPVPPWAEEAILQIGMLGATGSLAVDDIRMVAIGRSTHVPQSRPGFERGE
jgi:protein-L-isoaspartate(D-aspartate) O-methyltransferase